MKKLAGRDFEDLLQCAIPAFEGLLPAPHDQLVSDLLFTLATWHACAKLRLHTEVTLTYLDKTTTLLGQVFRKFISITCAAFVTRELPREEAARTRRRAAAAAKKTGKASQKHAATKQGKQPAITSKSRKRKPFNLCTYKFHALGDYAKTIRLFGTSDSYSTQVVRCGIILIGIPKFLIFRGNSNTVASNDSLRELIKINTPVRLPSTNVVREDFTP
jgi:hypothetical protein